MKTIKNKIFAALAVVAGLSLATACSDANEYEDTNTSNPSFGTEVPASLAGTKWVRGTGIKVNAYGQNVNGFVESLDFVSADSVAVVMSEGPTEGTWTDDSNTEKNPLYEYTYNEGTGAIQILKSTTSGKGVSKTALFTGTANTGSRDVITIIHFGDTPSNTYLVKQ